MKVLIGMDLTPETQRAFRDDAPGCDVRFVPAGRITAENAADADAVFGNPPIDAVPGMKKLRILQLNSAGCDDYVAAIRQVPGARLYCASGAYGHALSEHMLAMLLALVKKLHLYRDNQAAAHWEKMGEVRSIRGMRVLVLGLGDVGTRFAELARALGMEVVGMKRTAGPRPDCVDALYTVDALDDVLPTVDAVCMSLPNTPETRTILSAARIASMKPGAFVVNVGRGSAIDQTALAEALNDGRLGGAGLDVTTPEPLPADHPLWRAPNCLITPHASGGWSLPQTRDYVIALMRENLRAFVAGAPMRHEVDLERGY